MTDKGQTPDTASAPFKLELTPSRQFADWLAEVGASLVWTTYQGSRLFMVGLDERGRTSIFNRSLSRCMGLGVDERGMYVSSLYQIHRFENALKDGQRHGSYDRVYIPQVSHITGDVDVHDIGIDAGGRPIFVNTLFSCLATVSDRYSFEPIWRPPFVSRLAAEDRCHLNGLAMKDGQPRMSRRCRGRMWRMDGESCRQRLESHHAVQPPSTGRLMPVT